MSIYDTDPLPEWRAKYGDKHLILSVHLLLHANPAAVWPPNRQAWIAEKMMREHDVWTVSFGTYVFPSLIAVHFLAPLASFEGAQDGREMCHWAAGWYAVAGKGGLGDTGRGDLGEMLDYALPGWKLERNLDHIVANALERHADEDAVQTLRQALADGRHIDDVDEELEKVLALAEGELARRAEDVPEKTPFVSVTIPPWEGV